MSQQKLRYLGNGPGQGEGVAIGGIKYERNKTYKFNTDRAKDLLRRGGWEVVKSTKPKKKKTVEESES